MDKKPFPSFLIWENFIKVAKKVIQVMQEIFKNVDNFGKKYPQIAEIIQLSFAYFFGFIDLIFSFMSTAVGSGYLPSFLEVFTSQFVTVLSNPFLQFWATPERSFLVSYFVIEFMINRPIFKFSKLVRYNILLLFTILVVQGIFLSYWDLAFVRIHPRGALQVWGDAEEDFEIIIAVIVLSSLFVFFWIFYGILYWTAIQGKFFYQPGFYWLTDSVAFWLKIDTPTLKKRRKKGGKL